MLCVRFFLNHSIQINMQKIKERRQKVVGFQTPFFRVYKACGTVEIYVYQFRLFLADRYVTIHKGSKQTLLNKFTLSFMTLLVNIFFVPVVVVSYYPFQYFEGAFHFFKDSCCINGVRFFNFVNIAIIVLLSVLLFLN